MKNQCQITITGFQDLQDVNTLKNRVHLVIYKNPVQTIIAENYKEIAL